MDALKILTDKPTAKRLSGEPRWRWKDNTRMNFKKIVMNARAWVDSAQGRDYWCAFVNAGLNLQVP